MLTIWGRTNSINVQKVLWCCAELGIPYSRIEAGMSFGVVNTPDYLARNPNALVPAIDDDGLVLWESNVIVRYLSSRYGQGKLCPEGLAERFSGEKWMDWQATTLWPAFRPVFWGLIRTAAEKRDAKAIEAASVETTRILRMLDGELAKSSYVGGDSFSMGDIPVGANVYRCFALGIDRKLLPNIGRWYDGLVERPGFREHVMLPLS